MGRSRIKESFPDYKTTPTAPITFNDGTVSFTGLVTGTHTGPAFASFEFPAIETTGKQISLPQTTDFVFEGGKCTGVNFIGKDAEDKYVGGIGIYLQLGGNISEDFDWKAASS
jgi:hypothetical protein